MKALFCFLLGIEEEGYQGPPGPAIAEIMKSMMKNPAQSSAVGWLDLNILKASDDCIFCSNGLKFINGY